MKILKALILALCMMTFLQGESFAPITLKEEAHAGYLSLPKDKSINNTTYLYVKYGLEEFRKKGVSFVLLDLDTPGGEVFASMQIVEELRKMDSEYGIPVIALVDNWALSAGALLAYSCRFIGATEQSSMGAAEPVLAGSDGKMETASEKMVSALRVEFAKTAKEYDRDPILAEAMVDKDLVVVMRKGKITQLLDDSQITPKDEVIISKGKLLTLDGEEMERLGISSFFIPSASHSALSGKELLTKEPFFATAPITWISYSNWKIDFFSFLTHPFVSSILFFGLMIGLYGTIQNPTISFVSVLGMCCLSLILLSTFATQLVSWLEILILIVGLVLLVIDLFYLGVGFLGAIGIFLALGGLFAMILPSLDGTNFTLKGGEVGIAFSEWLYRLSLFLISLLVGLGMGSLASRFLLRKGMIGRRLVLKETEHKEEEEEKKPIKGDKGIAFSTFRPFGKVEIDGNLYEAESEGEFVQQGAKIEVIGCTGRFLIIREVKS
jgi:membrane-bound serine protease (ClpP class)